MWRFIFVIMNRNDLILSMQDIVKSIVLKYCHKQDEDLQSIGTIASIEAIDACLNKNIIDENIIKASCITRIRFAILKELYGRKKLPMIDEDDITEDLPMENEIDPINETILSENLLQYDLSLILEPQEYIVTKYIQDGYSISEIAETLELSASRIYAIWSNAKEKIINYIKV